MVGSAVATMVWSRAARNIVSIRLRTMVRTSSGDNGTGGAREGASLTLITSPGRRDNSSAMSSGNVWVSAGSPCRSNLFISGVSDVVVQRRNAAKDSFYAVLSKQQSSSRAGTPAHGCIPPPGHAECVIGAVRWRSVLRASLQAGSFRQQPGPLHDVVLELLVRNPLLAALDPAAHGDAGVMHGVGIA